MYNNYFINKDISYVTGIRIDEINDRLCTLVFDLTYQVLEAILMSEL